MASLVFWRYLYSLIVAFIQNLVFGRYHLLFNILNIVAFILNLIFWRYHLLYNIIHPESYVYSEFSLLMIYFTIQHTKYCMVYSKFRLEGYLWRYHFLFNILNAVTFIQSLAFWRYLNSLIVAFILNLVLKISLLFICDVYSEFSLLKISYTKYCSTYSEFRRLKIFLTL